MSRQAETLRPSRRCCMVNLGTILLASLGLFACTASVDKAPETTARSQTSSLLVYVNPRATGTEVASLRARLTSAVGITSCDYLNHQESYDYAVKLFRSEGRSFAIGSLTPATTPPLFVCHLRRGDAPGAVKSLVRRLPLVYSVEIGAWPGFGPIPVAGAAVVGSA
jgi:cell division protein FtsX